MQRALSLDPQERKRLRKMSRHERRLRESGYSKIAGIDEAGRGPLAGPVVAAACILPESFLLSHLNDSKQVLPELREELYWQITSHPDVRYGIGIVSRERIDEINILRATFEAMQQAVRQLSELPDYLLIDGNQLPVFELPCEAIVEGDGHSVSIAAASIIAKVTRDRLMIEEAKRWPQYGFEQHKGYSTPQHLEALRLHGPCPIHRRSFEPVINAMMLDLFA